jgi:hypothetical protein
MARMHLTVTAVAVFVAAAVTTAASAAPQPTIAAAPPAVTFGEGATISGTLAGGAANAGRPVTLQQQLPGAKAFANVFTGQADPAGNYAFPVTPASNVRYRVRAATTPTQTSNAVFVPVRIKIAFALSDRTPRKNALVRFSGLATPALDGAPVFIQRKNSAGAYQTVARTRLRDAGTASSQYSRRLRIGRDGTFRVFVTGTATLSAGASFSRVIRVHR